MEMSKQAMQLNVEIVSDVVCPWCIVGYLQLQQALDMLPGQFNVLLSWHPFELNPNMPQEGQNAREHIAEKYGSTAEQGRGARARLRELGTSLGFDFNSDENSRIYNTFQAHQLLHWARKEGLQTPLKLALFEAYFTLQQDVSQIDVLAAVAAKVGLSEDEARAVLADGRYAEDVRTEQYRWLHKEVQAVPTFVLNQEYIVPGAQEAETFVRVLNRIRERAVA